MRKSRNLMLYMSLIVLFIATMAWYVKASVENFGTSPGTMDQLRSTHVTTEEDVDFFTRVYPKMVRKDLIDMTDGDPGELRPWIFPWYGRGVTLIAQ